MAAAALFLVWTSTGLAGLLAHGSWPSGVSFTRAPRALRSLIGAPDELPAAWPSTPPGELSGYGLFWGLVIGQVMILAVLAVFTVGTLARWKAVRRARAAEAADRRHAQWDDERGGRQHGPWDDGQRHARWDEKRDGQRDGRRQGPRSPYAYEDTAPPPAPRSAAPGPVPPASRFDPPDPLPEPRRETGATAPGPAHEPAQGPGHGRELGPELGSAAAPPREPAVPAVPAPAVSGEPPATAREAAVPSPRPAPAVFFGGPEARRPTALKAARDAEGPLLVVTSDPALWAETKDARAKLGPVLVYDPGHLCDTPARLHWSPTARCEDAPTARDRAAALLAPVRPHARIDAAMADTAETLLHCWLHAAAVDGRPFKQVHRWAQGINTQESVKILRTHTKAAAGLAGLLEAALTAHPERREIAQQLVARALSSLSSIHIREACTPNRTDALALESFINEGGTLYLVGEPQEDPRAHPGAMPLLTALASDVVEHGRRMAARSSAGRLDPPLTLVLDDAAAVAPLPGLPALLASGPAAGLPAHVLLRSPEQARSRWQDPLPR
ncbi:type VI secretion protein [Streptomyces sp. NPDC003691]